MNVLKHTPFRFMTNLGVVALFTLKSVSINAGEHVHHHHQNNNTLQVEAAYATPTFALAKMGAGYFTLKNVSNKDVAITELSIAETVARTAEMHETYLDGDMAKMRRLTMPYVIKAGATVEFVPQGKHLMLIGLEKPLKTGNSFDLTLTFESGENQVVTIPVLEKEQGEKGEVKGHHHHH